MLGYGLWRPAIAGALLGVLIMLPRGDTVLAPLDTVSCAQLADEVRNSRIDCLPFRNGFVGPVTPTGDQARDQGAPVGLAPAAAAPAATVVAAVSPVQPAPVEPAPAEQAPAEQPPVAPAPVDPAPSDPADPAAQDSDGRSDSTDVEADAEAETDSDDESDSDGSRSGSSPTTSLSPGGYSGATSGATVPGAESCPNAATADPNGDAAVQRIGTTTGTAARPAEVIDLASWYLTLPTGQAGDPDIVEYPTLANFANEFFKLNDTRDGVVFSARGDGVTTKNSEYPRSELREMNGTQKAAWSNTSGTHVLDVCEAITKLPSAKPEVVAAQIHDGSDDVMQIRLEGRTLMVQFNDGGSEIVIDPNYVLGTPYNVRLVAAEGRVDIYYNGQKRVELTGQGSGWYWKVGAYVQSNTSKGDGADAVGEVVVYSLNCTHA